MRLATSIFLAGCRQFLAQALGHHHEGIALGIHLGGTGAGAALGGAIVLARLDHAVALLLVVRRHDWRGDELGTQGQQTRHGRGDGSTLFHVHIHIPCCLEWCLRRMSSGYVQ